MTATRVWVVAALSMASAVGGAQNPPARTLPAIHPLGQRVAVSRDTFAAVSGIRPLSDGRVLVNDGARRRIYILDSTLSHRSVALDSGGASRTAYGAAAGAGNMMRPAGIVPYRADTTLFLDPLSLAILVLDPSGGIARVIAAPHATDIPAMIHTATQPGARFDGHGSLIYARTASGMQALAADTGRAGEPPGVLWDSTKILRAVLGTTIVDTIGVATSSSGRPMMVTLNERQLGMVLDPLPLTDDWAVLSTGSVAILRAHDYHIDWIEPDGNRHATPPMPHDWHRLTDSARTAIIDSTQRWANEHPYTKKDTARVASMDELPDYRAPFVKGMYADADAHLWVRQTTDTPSPSHGPVYDVIDHDGRVVDRVEVPPELGIVGFAPGVIYMAIREGSGTLLVKQRIR